MNKDFAFCCFCGKKVFRNVVESKKNWKNKKKHFCSLVCYRKGIVEGKIVFRIKRVVKLVKYGND